MTEHRNLLLIAFTCTCIAGQTGRAAEPLPPAPRFSVEHMDKTVSPGADFYRYAVGNWLKNNPVPADKARWASFNELEARNWQLLRALLEEAAADTNAPAKSPRRQVGDFFRSAMDTNRIEAIGWHPLEAERARVLAIANPDDAVRLIADWHLRGIECCFGVSVEPDAKQSDVYALQLSQGGLGLPDRDYYLAEGFASQREAYRKHIAAMFRLQGASEADARAAAETVFALELELAKGSRSRTDLRDPNKNYHRKSLDELAQLAPDIAWDAYFDALGVKGARPMVVGQPEFFRALNRLATERPPEDWVTYLQWQLLRNTAPYLNRAARDEAFAFYNTILQGQPQPEPRWQQAARAIDGGFNQAGLGEALGQLYVEKHFPPAARARMNGLVADIRAVFADRLGKLEWMTPETRRQALRKFDRFTQKIGGPETFRDYSAVEIRPDDYFGNVQRTTRFTARRDIGRIGQPVARAEWHMTPPTVNAYFNPLQNEIVFPAGILQPPFFDLTLDDAVNFGGIGTVIGHEITHGYDDQGRKFDAEGNLRDWWTTADGAEFDARAQRLVEQYGAYEILPGAKVNGQLTLGENIADLGGVSLAYEALQRALARDPANRRTIDGFTPEQRFFLAFAQIWRANTREAEQRRRLVIDPHAPPPCRAVGPLVNFAPFYAAFDIRASDPIYRAPGQRAVIW